MSSARSGDVRRGVLLSAGGMLILSPDGLMLRLIQDAGLADIVYYRSVFMSFTLALVLWALNRGDWKKPWRGFGRIGFFACLLMTVSNITFVGAIAHTTVANVLVILAAMPLFSALLGWLLIRERVKPRTWFAIMAALSGVVVIFAGSLSGGGWLGIGLALATAIVQSLTLVVLRHAENDVTIPALCLSGLLSGGVSLFYASPYTVGHHDLTILALMGLLIVPVALTLFLSGTRYIPAAEVALFALLETVLGPLWVWLGVGEVPSAATWLGGAIVLSAIVIHSVLALKKPEAD
jgi:drug/metabolite transporter (DMT)-like permease